MVGFWKSICRLHKMCCLRPLLIVSHKWRNVCMFPMLENIARHFKGHLIVKAREHLIALYVLLLYHLAFCLTFCSYRITFQFVGCWSAIGKIYSNMIQRICIAAKDRDTNSRWYKSKHSAIFSSFHYYKWRLKRLTILNSIAIHLVTNIKPLVANRSKHVYPVKSNSKDHANQ